MKQHESKVRRPRKEAPDMRITLTPKEQRLYTDLDWRSGEHEAYLRNARPVVTLMRSLASREGIPDHRRRYFVDAAFNPPGRTSRYAVFVGNGCRRAVEIFAHPCFLSFLRYFIEGPALPAAVIKGFGLATKAPFPEWNALSSYVRVQAGQISGISPHEIGDEFFKLAIEYAVDPGAAADLATHARTTARRRQRRAVRDC